MEDISQTYIHTVTTEHLILPKPMYALAPPKFLTRNNPDFLKLQFMENPKSDSRTQVHCILLIVPKERKVKLCNIGKKAVIHLQRTSVYVSHYSVFSSGYY